MDKPTRLKRLYFRSAHRGSKETDLILGPYAAARLSAMSDAALDTFEAFLDENDADIWDWVAGKSEAQERYRELVDQLKDRS